MHVMEMTVHLSDTDVTGQAYYSKPLEWMEWCRVDWFTAQQGNFMKFVEATGITFFPAKVTAEYKKPIFFGDALRIEMKAKEIKKISFIFEYAIKRGEETVLKSDITMVCFNTVKKSLAALPPDLLEKIESLTQ
jgi:acyl-CoA thioester hydrolase